MIRCSSRRRARVDTTAATSGWRDVVHHAAHAAFRAWTAATVVGEVLAFGAYLRRRATAENPQRTPEATTCGQPSRVAAIGPSTGPGGWLSSGEEIRGPFVAPL